MNSSSSRNNYSSISNDVDDGWESYSNTSLLESGTADLNVDRARRNRNRTVLSVLSVLLTIIGTIFFIYRNGVSPTTNAITMDLKVGDGYMKGANVFTSIVTEKASRTDTTNIYSLTVTVEAIQV